MRVGAVLVLLGVFVLAAIGFRWKWFMNHYKVRRAYQALGRTGAIILYLGIGSALVVLGVLTMMEIIKFE